MSSGNYLQELEDSIRFARQSRANISADYDGREDCTGYKIQEQIRLASRGIIICYVDSTCLGGSLPRDEEEPKQFPPVNPLLGFLVKVQDYL